MNKLRFKQHFSIYGLFVFIAAVIIADFAMPGSIFNEQITEVEQSRQNNYNAARSYHYSYKVDTGKHKFLVSEEFAKSLQGDEMIEYSVSPLFKDVNWYRLKETDSKSYFSLRLVSGLILPLLLIILILIDWRYNKRIGTLIFILQVLLIGDLIFLIT